MKYVTYINNTSYGEGGISWENRNDAFSMEVNVPVSCHATVHVPASELSEVTESGKRADQVPGIEFLEMKDGYAVFKVGSGKYFFEAKK